MLVSASTESKMFKLRFMFLLRENIFEINERMILQDAAQISKLEGFILA